MSNPLNQQLYRALIRRFTHVTIANEGDAYCATRTRSRYRRGRFDSPPTYAGEYYRVCCPFCHDTRQRLWINHMFNVAGEDGDDHLYLAYCFNDQCVDSREMQKKLLDMIYPFGYRANQRMGQVSSHDVANPTRNESAVVSVRLPVSCSLQESISAPAHTYLMSRGFDPNELSDRWGVVYSLYSPNSSPRIFNRIVIPIHTLRTNIHTFQRDTVLAGWQAREIHPSPEPGCKYLSMQGMRKNHLLYGLPQAVNTTGLVVVVEGPTDVWRLGSNAVALLGKSISQAQISLLISHFMARPLLVVLDRDATADAEAIVAAIRLSRAEWRDTAPVILGSPPNGAKDFGESTREAAWASIYSAVAGQNANLNINP